MAIISNCNESIIKDAALALKQGHLVAFPTETVYGLGADATNEKAVARIYSVKGRPTGHPLIVHISSINKLEDWARNIPNYAINLAREFWPGPMTLILPRKEIAKDFITGGQDNVGLRVPDHPMTLALLRNFEKMGGQGIAAPSANRFGAVSPTIANAVEKGLGQYFETNDLILDGGPCPVGIESTIIDCTKKEPKILRPGFVTNELLRSFIPQKLSWEESECLITFPGGMKNHYAPNAHVKLDVEPQPGEGFVALSSITTPKGVIRISSPNNFFEYARTLYFSLTEADRLSLSTIVFRTPPQNGIGVAIYDRLQKAKTREVN